MSSSHHFSDEQLNTYFDGELSPEENAELLLALRDDPVLTQRLSRLMQVRGLVQMAYADVIPTESLLQPSPRRYPRLKVAFAAMLLLGIGGLSGWLAHRGTAGEPLPDVVVVVTTGADWIVTVVVVTGGYQ